MDVAKLDLWFRRGISVITFLFGVVQLYLSEKNIWVDAGFVICRKAAFAGKKGSIKQAYQEAGKKEEIKESSSILDKFML